MIYLIVARCQENNGIGFENRLPWKCKIDMERFVNLTLNKTVVMGYNTWVSIGGRALRNRENIVITRPGFYINAPGVTVFHSFLEFVKSPLIKKNNDIFIIGGEHIYRAALEMNIVQQIYLTQIHKTYKCDRFFPLDPSKDFECVDMKFHDECTFETWIKKNQEENQLIGLMLNVYRAGENVMERTGAGARAIFNKQNLVFSLTGNAFPLSTTRQASLKLIFEELMMNILGITDTKYLEEKGINIWRVNSTRAFLDSRGLFDFPEGVIGETYGFHMRNFGGKYDISRARAGDHYDGVDQLRALIDEIRVNPTSRRLIITLWNPNSAANCALPACACWYEFYVAGDKLSCKLVQRSSDVLVAGHHNITYGCLFTILIAHVCNLKPHEFIWSPSNVHIYNNNLQFVEERCAREPYIYPLLFVKENAPMDIEKFQFSDLQLVDYNYHLDKNKYTVN